MRRIAANPVPYWVRDGRLDKSRATFDEAFADLAAIGFPAVKADVPDDMTAAEYAAWIGGYGLEPSLSLFSSPFDETIDIVEEMERAKRFAEIQVELGLDRTMVSSMSIPERWEQPAVGAAFDPDRLALAIENCGIVCEVLRREGLRPLHHPDPRRPGGVFETEYEITRLLDELGSGVIGFGPDTGHLRWAGIDPAVIIKRYADRVGGIHIKDIFGDHLDGNDPGGTYPELVATQRLRAEPGLGVIDFDAVLAAFPDDYDGDFMIEVDHPRLTLPVRVLPDLVRVGEDRAAASDCAGLFDHGFGQLVVASQPGPQEIEHRPHGRFEVLSGGRSHCLVGVDVLDRGTDTTQVQHPGGECRGGADRDASGGPLGHDRRHGADGELGRTVRRDSGELVAHPGVGEPGE